MGKILIVVAVVVILTACGAVAYVALHQAAPAAPEPATAAAATEPLVAPDSAVPAAAPADEEVED